VVILLPWISAQTNGRIDCVSCLGFCFGGWVVARALALSAFKCGVGIHPSFQLETVHGSTQVAAAENVGSKPILLLPAGNDELKPGHEAVQILAKARGVVQEEVSVEFPTMIHGWVTRGDSTQPDICENQLKALQMTVDFIEKHHPINESSSI
jgi:dienelactone hydrolase